LSTKLVSTILYLITRYTYFFFQHVFVVDNLVGWIMVIKMDRFIELAGKDDIRFRSN